MLILQSESNIKPTLVNVDYTIVDVNLNVVEDTKDGEVIYRYDTYRFDKSELLEKNDNTIKIEALIRIRYSINDELGILRKQHTHPKEYEEYDKYVRECIERVKLGC